MNWTLKPWTKAVPSFFKLLLPGMSSHHGESNFYTFPASFPQVFLLPTYHPYVECLTGFDFLGVVIVLPCLFSHVLHSTFVKKKKKTQEKKTWSIVMTVKWCKLIEQGVPSLPGLKLYIYTICDGWSCQGVILKQIPGICPRFSTYLVLFLITPLEMVKNKNCQLILANLVFVFYYGNFWRMQIQV